MRQFAPLSLLCAFVGTASAQVAQLHSLVSSDNGATWSSSVDVLPGSTVFVQISVSLKGATALGLDLLRMQPTLSNWNGTGGDIRNPFTFPGLNNLGEPTTETSYEGRHVAGGTGETGRLFPFGIAGQGPTSSSGLLTSFIDPDNTLRFAGSKNTSPTTNLQWGVSSSQLPLALANPGIFVSSLDVAIFRYSITLADSDVSARTLVADVPIGYMDLSGRTRWYLNSMGTVFLDVIASPAETASINVVPSPSGLSVVLLGTLALRPFRRRKATIMARPNDHTDGPTQPAP